MLRRFLSNEAAGGYVLMAAAALALVVANSPWAAQYFSLLKTYVGFDLGPIRLNLSVLHWINDALMAVFFLLVGLEIKREVLDGQLSRPTRVILPGVAAIGGVVVPALIYMFFNGAYPETRSGWAIPAATDIAFALGVLALLGSKVPTSLKIFLTAIAIMDDLVAIMIIALFYTANLNVAALGLAAVALAGLILLNRMKVRRLWPYLTVGVLLWYFVLLSGVHATLAGVALALTIPLNRTPGRPDDHHCALLRLENALHKPVAFLIVPIFGFANAGLSFAGITPSAVVDTVPLGVAAGLFFGKQIGIFGTAMLVIRLGLADMPRYATVLQLYGVSVLCGIGFTMSLFIGNLAFASPLLIDETKIGVLVGSGASALLGFLVLSRAKPDLSAARPNSD